MAVTSDSAPTKIHAPAETLTGRGLLWLALAAVGGAAFFWDGIVSLLKAWSLPEYSHGPIIPLIAAYLLLREFQGAPPASGARNRLPGMLVLLAGLFVGLIGNLTQIPDLITYGLIVAIGGLILLLAGARDGFRYWVGWIYLFFMLPLPNIIYWQVSTELQFISSRLGVEFIQSVGIPVYLNGNVIDLGIYQLQVAEACSGLRYLFPLTSFGFLFAVLYKGPVWHKIVLFLSSIPITILMNSLRIGVIGVLVDSFGIAQAEGFLHWFEGWIIFLACITLLYLEAIILQRLVARPQPVMAILDLEFTGILGPLRAAGDVIASRHLIAAALLLVASGALWQLTPSRAVPVVERQTLAEFPMEFAGWKGTLQPKLDPTIEQVLGADEYLLADYVDASGQSPVNLFMTYYHKTTGGPGIHSPEVCIPGGGWEISRWEPTLVSSGNPATPEFLVNRAVIQKGQSKQIVYYWFEQRGRHLNSEYTAKFYAVWDAITRSRTDGALVRFVTPLAPGEPEAAADERLKAFLASVFRIIPDFVPE